jgi:hypothetical protein
MKETQAAYEEPANIYLVSAIDMPHGRIADSGAYFWRQRLVRHGGTRTFGFRNYG